MHAQQTEILGDLARLQVICHVGTTHLGDKDPETVVERGHPLQLTQSCVVQGVCFENGPELRGLWIRD